ncbi:MAG: hypothetical protein K4H23_05510 [Mollicutes bacterium PWAP]|nr:hypothetical protein [Mollicutes bacterium PWAP]
MPKSNLKQNFSSEELKSRKSIFDSLIKKIENQEIDLIEINELIIPTILKNKSQITDKDYAWKNILFLINEMITIFLKTGEFMYQGIRLIAPVGRVGNSNVSLEGFINTPERTQIWNFFKGTLTRTIKKNKAVKFFESLIVVWNKEREIMEFVQNPYEIIDLQKEFF